MLVCITCRRRVPLSFLVRKMASQAGVNVCNKLRPNGSRTSRVTSMHHESRQLIKPFVASLAKERKVVQFVNKLTPLNDRSSFNDQKLFPDRALCNGVVDRKKIAAARTGISVLKVQDHAGVSSKFSITTNTVDGEREVYSTVLGKSQRAFSYYSRSLDSTNYITLSAVNFRASQAYV